MVTPENVNDFTNSEILEEYTKINQDLTKMIINKIIKTGDISSYTRSQMRTIIKLGGKEIFKNSVKRINTLNSSQKKKLNKLFDEIAKEEKTGYKSIYDDTNTEYKISDAEIKIVSNAINRTNKTLKNITKSVAFENKKAFVDEMDDLYLKVTSGGYSYDKAIKETVNKLATEGIKLESKGRNYSLESIVKLNLRTAITQTANELSKEIGDQIGANCVRIFHSPTCRPSHYPIDDVLMSIDEFKKHEHLTQEPNCNHVVNYTWDKRFKDGKDVIFPKGRLSEKEIEQNYVENQKANYYARQVRNKKNIIASGDKSQEAKNDLRNAQLKYRTYCKENGIDIDYDKTWKAGYNK